MNKKEKESSYINEIVQKDSSSDEQENSFSDQKNIILGFDEHPETIIEKILIKIFNSIITNKNNNEDALIISYQKQINNLCLKHEKSVIIFFLLINIRNLIKKYRNKILEMPGISKLQKNLNTLYRKYTVFKKYSSIYMNFGIDRDKEFLYKSYPKRKEYLDYFGIIKNLFNKLKEIKDCLKNSAPIIEKIFELPLSQYEKFSILDCEKEDYVKRIIHDNFIWNEIIKNKKTQLDKLIQEITWGNDTNINTMSIKIEYFKRFHEEILKIAEIGSSIDKRFPEDAKPVKENISRFEGYYNNIYNLINDEQNNICSNKSEEDEEDSDIDIERKKIEDNDIKNINMIRFNRKNINNIDKFNHTIITNNTINGIDTININENNKFKDVSNINKIINNEKLEKNFSFNNKHNMHNSGININSINDKNISNISKINIEKPNKIKILNKEKLFKNPEQILFKNKKNTINKNKKENLNGNNGNKKYTNSNKNIKIDKKEIPSDIDDLVKYIENDNKNDTQVKKKKRNKKKTKKKNKNEIEINKKEQIIDEEKIKEKKEDDEINEIKKDFLKNSINRFKIHKIKFKYKQQWLEKISKDP